LTLFFDAPPVTYAVVSADGDVLRTGTSGAYEGPLQVLYALRACRTSRCGWTLRLIVRRLVLVTVPMETGVLARVPALTYRGAGAPL
jgi:hypothetical protein